MRRIAILMLGTSLGLGSLALPAYADDKYKEKTKVKADEDGYKSKTKIKNDDAYVPATRKHRKVKSKTKVKADEDGYKEKTKVKEH